jgi:hypothetical protein
MEGTQSAELFGTVVAFSKDGSTVAGLSPSYNANACTGCGRVRIFTYSSGSWLQLGSDIMGTGGGDFLGTLIYPTSLSLTFGGRTLVVGFRGSDSGGTNRGNVIVYSYTGGTWATKPIFY